MKNDPVPLRGPYPLFLARVRPIFFLRLCLLNKLFVTTRRNIVITKRSEIIEHQMQSSASTERPRRCSPDCVDIKRSSYT